MTTMTPHHRLWGLRAHVQTWRPYTLWYVGLLGVAGAGLSAWSQDRWLLLVAWATPTLGWLGGHYLSDYLDRDLDAVSKPHRPIPSGRLRPGVALGCGVAALSGVAVLALFGTWRTVLVAGLALAGIVSYGVWLKAYGLAGNLVRGALGALALLYGATLAPAVGPAVVPFAVAFWLHDTSSNLVGTLRDIAGDRVGGYRTLPVRYGSAVAVGTALLSYAMAMVLCAFAIGVAAAAEPGRIWYLGALAAVAAVGAATFGPLLRNRRDLPAGIALHAHEVIVLERLGLVGVAVGVGLGARVAAALLVPALVLTWTTQRRMRREYELGAT